MAGCLKFKLTRWLHPSCKEIDEKNTKNHSTLSHFTVYERLNSSRCTNAIKRKV